METLWEALVAPMQRELAASGDLARTGAMSCRLALLSWDLVGDAAAVQRWLDRADAAHPQAVELRRQLLLEQGDAGGAAELLESQSPPGLLGPLLLEAILLRILWSRDFRGAATAIWRGAAGAEVDPQLGELVGLALSLADDSEGLLELATQGAPRLAALVRTSLSLWDRKHEAGRAAELLRSARCLDEGDLYLLELSLELSFDAETSGERRALLEKKLAQLSLEDARGADARAVCMRLARDQLDAGELERAASLVARVDPAAGDGITSPEHGDPTSFAPMLLLELRRDLAARTGDRRQLGGAYLQLSHASGIAPMARVYRLRAAQLLGLEPGEADRAESLLAENFAANPGDPHTARSLEEQRLRDSRMVELCRQYEAQAAACQGQEVRGVLLRKASLLAEAYLRDRALAASLRRDGLAHQSDPSGNGDLQRHYRALGSDTRLVEAYARGADASGDPAWASLLWSEAAVVHLKRGQLPSAETAARDALRAQPTDPLALEVLAFVLRAQERSDDLRWVLEQQATHLLAPINRVAALRSLAAISEDPAAALEPLLSAHTLLPDDPEVLRGLVDASEAMGMLAEAARWGQQLCHVLRDDIPRKAAALLHLGRLRLEGLDDREGAVEALEAALAIAPRNVEAARALGASRRGGEPGALLAALQRLLPLELEAGPRAALLLEIGRTLELQGHADEAIASVAEAASLDPSAELAQDELERCCRQAGCLDRLAALLARLPECTAVLARRARILYEAGDLEALCEVQARLVELSSTPQERADRGFELGRMLEQAGRAGEATRQYEVVVSQLTGHQPALQALQRIYRAEGRVEALARVLEDELKVTTEAGRRVELLLDLGRGLEEDGRPEEAATFLEQAVLLQPENLDALWALERIYAESRPMELGRVLQLRARVTVDDLERSILSLRAARLLVEHGADDPAIVDLLRRAFYSAPDNREAFTAYESWLYERARLTELMELYDAALHHVEHESSRAYRPADLYARKGQLQLNHLAQPGEAAASYLKALECDPKSESAMKMLETVFLQQQDWLGLVRAYEHRATLVPRNELFRLESLRQAARLAMSRLPDQPGEAERIWKEISRLDPIDEEALENLERIYEEGDEYAKLADLLEHRAALLASQEARVALHFQVAALVEEQLEDPERAATAYENVRSIEEHNEQALKSLARIYEATGRWSECLAVLRDLVIIEADPDERALLYFKCGSILETHFRDDEETIRCYELSIHEARGCLPAIHGLRDLHLRREDWNRALDTLELEYQVWEEARERAGILARMGEIRLLQLRDVRKATEHFQDALAVDPECHAAALALFNIAFERGDPVRALSLCEPLALRLAREGDPEARSQFYSRRGQLLAGSGHLQQATESLVVALELRPKNLEALDWLIALCRRSPDAYDFAAIFRELEQVYRREGDAAAVGHVLVAAGALAEIAGDAETALSRYREAVEAAVQDLAPVRSLSELLVGLRRPDEAAAELRRLCDRAADPSLRVKALLRLAELYSVVCGDSERAAAVYLEVLLLDPGSHEVVNRLAQEQISLGRFDDACRTMRSLLDRATSEAGSKPRELSAYLHHLGVILLKLGDEAGAVEQFRQALQLDETNAEASMALARRLALAGDRDGAEQLLRRTLGLLGEPVGPAAMELRRSLAGLYLGAGRAHEAIACYDTVVREGGRLDDRLMLAEVCSRQPEGVSRAMAELQRILEENSLDMQVLHLLAELCESGGAPDRALQVLKVLEMLGGAAEGDRDRLHTLRRELPEPLGSIDAALRPLLEPPLDEPQVEDLWRVIQEPLEALFPPETTDQKPVPIKQAGSESLRELALRCCQLIGVEATVHVADDVPGGVVVSRDGGGRVILDRVILEQPRPEIAFVLGRSLEYLRSGHGLISRLAFDDRLLLCEILTGLLRPSERGADLVQEFRRGVPRRTLKQIDDVVASYTQRLGEGVPEQLPSRWLAGVDRSASQHGLLASDEIGAALRMLAQLGGQELAIGPGGEVAVQLVSDGPALVRFFLSTDYLRLRNKARD